MFFDQFHETKSRHLSSEPLTALKNSYLNFHEIGQKTLLLPRFLLFMNFKCYFVITPTYFECLHFEIIKSVFSEPVILSSIALISLTLVHLKN